MTASAPEIAVTAHARLHLGFLDLEGGLGRRFGGLGVSLEEPVTRLRLTRAAALEVDGPEADRARRHLLALCRAHDVAPAFRLAIEAAIPAHAGLGSGTQLALAVGRAFSQAAGIPLAARDIAALLGRGARSGVGVGLFEQGGLVLDGGRGPATQIPPVLCRIPLPESWRILLIFDSAAEGVHGMAENEAFRALPPFPGEAAARLCRLALMQALPAAAEADLPAFGAAIEAIQAEMGRHFAPAQGGSPWTSAAVGRALDWLRAQGIRGLGQSSWGPTGFAFLPDEGAAQTLFNALRAVALGGTLRLQIVKPRNRGAEIHVASPSRRYRARLTTTSRALWESNMATPNILHMVTPLKHMSPFDVNMALDAGYDAVVPYTQVTVEEIRGLVQDAIFSRAPQAGPRTALFIAGKNAVTALDMLDQAREAMMPPFAVSVFADPAGSFTTAAAMVACVLRKLQERTGAGLSGRRVAVFGGTGVVSFSSAVIAAREGAQVRLVGYDGDARVKRSAEDIKARFNVAVEGVNGCSEDKRRHIASTAEVILCAGPAGVRVLDEHVLAAAGGLLVAADANAVPPSGVAGIGMHDDGAPLAGTPGVGIGPLAIGNVKYQTEAGLFRRMIASDQPLILDFRDAYALARDLTGA